MDNMEEKIMENKGAKYSEMLYELVRKFDDKLPEKLTFEDTLEIGIDAWNLANKKGFLQKSELYEKELENHSYPEIIDEMVSFKLENFSNFNNIIIDYSTENDILQVKTQTPENHLNSFLKNTVSTSLKQTD